MKKQQSKHNTQLSLSNSRVPFQIITESTKMLSATVVTVQFTAGKCGDTKTRYR